MKRTLVVLIICLLFPTSSGAGFDEGWTAYYRGDYATALKEWRPLADQGDAVAQFSLGLMYAQGEGVPQDYTAAMKWFRKAADQGHASAQYHLGFMYYEGEGVPQDYVQAHMWFNLAATKGDKDAVKNRDIVAGLMTPADLSKAQKLARDRVDYATALKEWRPLADQGDAPAQFNLGLMYDEGQGVPQDYTAAVKWYRKAADQGLAPAQYNLGFMYANGQGMPQDYVQAHMWFNLAATKGDKDAVKNRDIVAKRMTPADISKAQNLAREWMAKFAQHGEKTNTP